MTVRGPRIATWCVAALLACSAGGLGCKRCYGSFPPLIAHPEFLKRDELLSQLGTPETRKVLSAAEAVKLLHQGAEDEKLRPLLERVAPEKEVELIAWEAFCSGRLTDRFIGAFDPVSGELLVSDGTMIYFSWSLIAE